MSISMSQLDGGAVGGLYSYALLALETPSTLNQGSTRAGSTLYYCGTYQKNADGIIQNGSRYVNPSGSWRLMGVTGYMSGSALAIEATSGSLWVRYA